MKMESVRSQKPIPLKKKQKAKRSIILESFALLICFLLLYVLLVSPALKLIQSRHWPKVQASVTDYEIKETGITYGDDGNRVEKATEMTYRYEFNGTPYEFTQTFSGYQTRPGLNTFTCQVNPSTPSEHLIDRSIPAINYLLAAFVGVGIGAAVADIRKRLKILTAG